MSVRDTTINTSVAVCLLVVWRDHAGFQQAGGSSNDAFVWQAGLEPDLQSWPALVASLRFCKVEVLESSAFAQ